MNTDGEFDALVVGAGFSGLATSAALRRYGVQGLRLIDAGAGYGAFWDGVYDRVMLHSPWHGVLDDGGLNAGYPIFKSRLQVRDYLTRYAERHLLGDVSAFGEALLEATYVQDDLQHPWRARTSKGEYRVRHLVIATGYCRRPVLPPIAGDTDGLPVIHSAAYRNGRPFRGQRVLVAGSGNSAFEIATDLVEHGAGAVTLLVHGPRWVFPLADFEAVMVAARAQGAYSVDAITAAHPFTRGSAEYAAAVGAFDGLLRSIAVDVTDLGISTPATGPWQTAIGLGRNGVFDHGALPLMRAGAIEVLNDRIARYAAGAVEFLAHGKRRYDAIIMATGFEPGVGDFITDERLIDADDARGHAFPRTDGRCTATRRPGLYFVGFDLSPWGGMAHGHWGYEIGEKIATSLGTFSPDLRPAEFRRAPWMK